MKDRREFLKTTGMMGLASMIPFGNVLADESNNSTPESGCVLIPSETAGPFPLDLTANNFYFRQDVRETRVGVQLNLRMRIIGLSNCQPMQNVRVNIWHCDKDGNYSGYGTQTGLTYLRGYQITDANGDVEFITIFPGWYPGRVCHIHFQVYVSSSYAAISQLTFDVAEKQAIYTANPSIYTAGTDPVSPGNDNIFSDGYQYQISNLTPNGTSGGYDAFLQVAVQGSGTTGIGHLEKENAKQFTLGQNFPNPYYGETTIPINLKYPSELRIELYDLNARNVTDLVYENLGKGEQHIPLNFHALALAQGNYIYQVEVKNMNGIFREYKMMTAGR
ncbi:MAG: T9SS C-terminal target domain-containing protein [Bacteroidetes bacterium]|nr:MAG: T9SS C-terminal target domain-containing protein [Bacteroidota bacterium]REK05720.1 MAG: T9SS C-terminal target domain-containing protein [Bacteroidota bacterium]REK31974.1 MAG: T9SS C-terminal target domain-containing protein [Bacteroidota bacterium]REK50039.1 MAG: T9SS C-terminal target domain-containing protein [Bacteroidota bacterium]